MASSSSAKKVSRLAAKSGTGSSANTQKNWLFPVAIVALVLLGIGVVVFARSQNGGTGDNTTPPRARLTDTTPSDHWHAAFAVNVCGKELPAPTDATSTDALGIHTHGDGLIHIHPFVIAAAGKRATMNKFLDQVGITVTDNGFKLANGKVYEAGKTTCDGKPTEVVVAHWKDATTASKNKPDKIFTKDFGKINFTENLGAYTLALVPKGDRDIPAPSSGVDIEKLGQADGGSTTGTAGDTSGGTGDTTGSSVLGNITVPETTAPASGSPSTTSKTP